MIAGVLTSGRGMRKKRDESPILNTEINTKIFGQMEGVYQWRLGRAKREKDEIMEPQVVQGRYFPGDPHLLIDARLRSAPAALPSFMPVLF